MPNLADSLVAPIIDQLASEIEPEDAFGKLCRMPHCVFLDSALRHPTLGRYSFIAADPFDYFELPADGSDALGELQRRVKLFTTSRIDGLPPFQGGAVGLFAFELAHSIERIPRARWDEFQLPALAIGLYDVVVAFDHQQCQSWLISQGLPETEPTKRRERAEVRLRRFREVLATGEIFQGREPCADRSNDVESLNAGLDLELAPQFTVPGPQNLTSNFSAQNYKQAVQRVIDYIHAGDVFQVNLSQRLLYPGRDDSVDLYLRMRQRNPATFAAYFDLGQFQIVSASPERFLRVREGLVEARPIKGTRQRTSLPEADLFAASDLQQSEKDRAENVMIVDLLRNDLSRVCQSDSIVVPQLCEVEVYQFVQHLVSSVEGRLRDDATPIDLLRSAFPGGSITGAPKVRAMEIIAELEPTARGAYCGSLGYVGFDGTMDLNILIRTITAGRGWWQLPVGGGIVAQSEPEREYEETWHKAEGLLRALV